jgi:hypothetical protein
MIAVEELVRDWTRAIAIAVPSAKTAVARLDYSHS